MYSVLEFWSNLWGLEEVSNRVVVPARQATKAGENDSLESIPELLKSFITPPQYTYSHRDGGEGRGTGGVREEEKSGTVGRYSLGRLVEGR